MAFAQASQLAAGLVLWRKFPAPLDATGLRISSEGGVQNAAGEPVTPRESGDYLMVKAGVQENGKHVVRSCCVTGRWHSSSWATGNPPVTRKSTTETETRITTHGATCAGRHAPSTLPIASSACTTRCVQAPMLCAAHTGTFQVQAAALRGPPPI